MSQEDRKAELERKKQRLAEIREEKRRREEDRRRRLLEHQDTPDGGTAQPNVSLQEVDAILADVGITPPPASAARDRSPAGREGTPIRSSYLSPSPGGRPAVLTKSEMVQVDIAPKEQVNYCKTTQTDSAGGREFICPGSMEFDYDWEDPLAAAGGTTTDSEGGRPPLMSGMSLENQVFLDSSSAGSSPTRHHAGLLASLLPHVQLTKPPEPTAVDAEATVVEPLPELSEEEKLQILSSQEFSVFFDRASRVIERALEEVDVFVDYTAGPDQDADKHDSGQKLALNRYFFDEKWSKGRCISGLDCALQHPELVAASYNNSDNPHEPDGVVLVWNSKFKKTTPEFVFHNQSRVTSVAFAKFHPNLILGGGYSGQICLWDNRHNKKTPVQKSPLSTTAHTHPVYSLQVVGTQNAHNLISVSTDGRMCAWSLDMLSQPVEIIDLTKTSKQVAATCLSFPLNDVNNFFVGAEDGGVYNGCRHGSKAGITDAYEGHFAPITGLECHGAVGGQVDFSHLFLSSSFDWTVKLWNSKEKAALASFENHSDYVFDVKWSPAHPAVFACCDGGAQVDLWNLNRDIEAPVESIIVDADNKPALNKLLWLASGQQLAVGDDSGTVWLYDVHESVSVPKPDEWTRFARTLAEMKQAQLEAIELSQAMHGMQTAAAAPTAASAAVSTASPLR